MTGYTSRIKEEIERLPYNQIIVASELYRMRFSNVPSATYYKVLDRMAESGLLVHLTKGIYYRPKLTRFGKIPISEEEIVRYYTSEEKGVIVGYPLYNKAGITTQVGKQVEVLSQVLKEDKKNIQNVLVRKISLELNEQTIPIIETLEILQNYKKIENANNKRLVAYMEKFAKIYSDQAANYVLSQKNYKKSTIAFLEKFLNHMDVENTLGQYLSPLSNYAIPKMEGFL